MTVKLQFEGLAWVDKNFGPEPRWTVEPDVGAIEQTIQSLRPSSKVQVTFLAQGGFNKIYDVNIDNELFIMWVSLPVDPYYKTISEVSTVHWISRTTRIPVPRIVTYQSSRENNPVGFEWILMIKMPGKPLGEIWHSVSFSAKASIVEQFADYASSLFRNKLQGIGNIYKAASIIDDSTLAEATWPSGNPAHSKESPLSAEENMPGGLPDADLPEVGRIVSMHFFWGSNLLQDVDRGPFGSSKDWIASRLSLSEKYCVSTLDNFPSGELGRRDANKADDATRTLEIVRKLQNLLPSVFPPIGDRPEPSIMVHDDLSSQNILVNESGELTAVLDWECVSALPVWKACGYPEFLKEKTRHVRPELGNYKPEENGEPSELYWEHLLDHEVTQLRDVFLERMKILEPDWVDVFKNEPASKGLRHCSAKL
ncbi:unnamed protein product [Penicillium salamii]|nr:unnamed protein product [Penicillium salamii]